MEDYFNLYGELQSKKKNSENPANQHQRALQHHIIANLLNQDCVQWRNDCDTSPGVFGR